MATATDTATTTGPNPATEIPETGIAYLDGAIGPVATRIGDRYHALAHGDDAAHPEWRTAVYR